MDSPFLATEMALKTALKETDKKLPDVIRMSPSLWASGFQKSVQNPKGPPGVQALKPSWAYFLWKAVLSLQ